MKKTRILVVEDERIVAEDIKTTVEGLGYDVCGVFGAGAEALAQLEGLEPDLILMDIVLKGELNGIETAEKIRSDWSIPVVYLTAYGDETTIQRAKQTHPYGYIMKPFNDRELHGVIEMALYRHGMEQKMAHLNVVLRAVRDVNKLITHEKDRNRLLAGACRLLVETRGFFHVHIVLTEGGRPVEPFFHAGFNSAFALMTERLRAGKLPHCARLALAKDRVQVTTDQHAQCGNCPLAMTHADRGALSKRLEHGGHVFGWLAVSVPQTYAVDPDEHSLLSEVAGDIAFALHSIDVEQEHRAIQADLRERERLLNGVEEIAKIGGWEMDLEDGGKATWTKGVYDIAEIEPDEPIPGANEHLDWYLPEYREMIKKKMEALIETRRPMRFEAMLKTKKGNLKWCQALGEVLEKAGKVVGLRGTFQDITDRKQWEAALENAQLEKATILDHQPFHAVLQDLDNRVIWANQVACESVGMSREEVIGRLCYEIWAKRSDTCPDCPVRKSMQTGRPESNQKSTPDGRFWHIRGAPIRNKEGTIIRALEVTEDITERRQSEEERHRLRSQLHQAQKMEAIGTLAGGIAHDFNNILSAVMGYTHLSLEMVPRGSSLQTNLGEVLSAATRATELVKQILTFSRQAEMEVQPVRVELIVREALKLLRASLPTTIEIDRDIQSHLLVMADPSQIHQVMMNLCVNAGHSMDEKGGVLGVYLADVDLDDDFAGQHPGTSPGPHIKLTVSDTGHGMDGSTMERIFQPYFTTKGKGEGTGLGLSVVHGIVASFGGDITVDSEPGKGTTFCVYFPAVETDKQPDVHVQEVLPRGREHILFVDDEPVLATLGKIMLGALGYRVATRTSPVEALEAFRAVPDRFDLVVTDMTMPVMTGDTLAKAMRKIRPDLPVILCTGFSTKITKEKAEAMGIQDLLMKPLINSVLAKAVRRALDGKALRN